jgi:hypothetical protein
MSHVLVCDLDEKLISRFQHRNIVVRVGSPDLVTKAVRVVQEHNNLYTCWLNSNASLSSLDITELEKSSNVPLYIEIAGLGNFRESIEHVRLLRNLDALVMLPEDAPGTYRDLKILSSLFVPCGIIFRNQCPDWESLADSISYYYYNKVPHAPIQPFHFVISNYSPQKRIDFNSVYFDNPSRFLHIDIHGHIALSKTGLEKGELISIDLEDLDNVINSPSFTQRADAWREFFLKPDGCAYCPNWRICLGKFAGSTDKESGCMIFFSELMDAAENYQEKKANIEAIHKPRREWQT